MPLHLIACVSNYKNNLAIGKNNELLFKLKEDLTFFKEITTNQMSKYSKLEKNVVLMGRKTWYSIPSANRPLKNRINIVLTKDKHLRKMSPYPWNSLLHWGKTVRDIFDRDTYYWTLSEFQRFYRLTNANVFVIGGAEIYKLFLSREVPTCLSPVNVYITEVTDKKWESGLEPDAFMPPLDARYKLIGVSNKNYDAKAKVHYRFLTYNRTTRMVTSEIEYLRLCQNVIDEGRSRDDRTGVGTYSVFGRQLHLDISHGVPLLTSKRVPWKHVIHELLWFMRGDTNAKILQKDGVKIWDGNTSREFLDKRGLYHYPEGVLGASYGWQWRFFGAKYCHAFADTSQLDTSKIGGFDQLQYIVTELKNNPYGRRTLMCYWNPPDFEKMALLPCFPAGTLVLTNKGYIAIEDVKLDMLLYTHKGNWKQIVNLQSKDYIGDMYTIKLYYNSKSLSATKEHPFYVRDVYRNKDKTIKGYSDPYWCNASELKKGQHVICLPINKQSILPVFDIQKRINQHKSVTEHLTIMKEEEWFTLGYFLGDGWIEKGSDYRFNFVINKKDMDVKDIMSKVLHLTYKDETDQVIRYVCCNKVWCEIIRQFGHLAHNKRIPEWVQNAPIKCIESFIAGYTRADGHINQKGDIIYTTVSHHVAYGLQRLYAKLGKVMSVSYQERPRTKVIQGRVVNQRNTYLMKSMVITKLKHTSTVDEDFLNFPIMSIAKTQKELKVYNFEVEEDNSYTVQNMSVHNCHFSCQFYVSFKNGEQYLDCHFTMRSTDVFLGLPFNIFSYAVLTYIIALKCDMQPGKLVYTGSDVHIYKNHIDQVKEQLSRTLRPLPVLIVDKDVKHKDFANISISDFDIAGYFPHPPIKAAMAV